MTLPLTACLTVVRLTPDHVPALLDFYTRLSEEVVRRFRPYGWAVTEQILRDGPFARLANNDECASVLEDKSGKIVGHAFLQDTRSGAPQLGIGIHQDFLGQKWGRRLMTALLADARALSGVKHIWLICLQDNAAAIHLYSTFGFTTAEEFTGEDDNLPYYLMRKQLSVPS